MAPATMPVRTAPARSTSMKAPCVGRWASAWVRLPGSCWQELPMSRADKPLPPLSYLQPRIRLSRLLAALGYAGLLACLFIYNAFIADLHSQAWARTLLGAMPRREISRGAMRAVTRTRALAP